jgi:chromosome segregation ATPase
MTDSAAERFREIDVRLESLSEALTEFREQLEENTGAITTLQRLTSELLEIARLHQQALRVSQVGAEADRAAIREMQAEVRGIQTENRRILDHLFGVEDEQQDNGS